MRKSRAIYVHVGEAALTSAHLAHMCVRFMFQGPNRNNRLKVHWAMPFLTFASKLKCLSLAIGGAPIST